MRERDTGRESEREGEREGKTQREREREIDGERDQQLHLIRPEVQIRDLLSGRHVSGP